MQDFSEAFFTAFSLLFSFDADLMEVIGLSLRVSLTALLVAGLIGLSIGALLAVTRFPGTPIPSGTVLWPYIVLSPQQATEPSSRRTTVWFPPAAMSVTRFTCVDINQVLSRGKFTTLQKYFFFGRLSTDSAQKLTR